MHILKIIPGYPTPFDPSRMIWLKTYIEGLARYHKVSVIILESLVHYLKPKYRKIWIKERGFPRFVPEFENVTFYPVSYWALPGMFGYTSVTFPIIEKEFFKVWDQMKLESVDVIHAHFSSPAGTLARKLSQKIKKPYIITEHASNWDYLIRHGVEVPQNIKEASKVIAVSPLLQKKVGVTRENVDDIEVIPMGTDFSRFLIGNSDLDMSTLKLLFVGWLESHKGCHVLLKALSFLKRKQIPFELTVIGEGKQKNVLMDKAKVLEIENHVIFAGNIETEELVSFYQKCHIFVLPSFRESFGMVVVEALACGKPVVATRSGGPESIVEDVNGILVPVNNSKILGEAIEKIWNSYASYNSELIRNSAKKYSLESVVERTNKIYEQFAS